MLSSHPVRRILPSGLNATALTAPGCGNGRSRGVSVATSHNRACRRIVGGEERLAVGAERPGIDRAGCPRGGPAGAPVDASQSRIVLSWQPVMMVLPSGLNATTVTAALMRERGTDGPAGRRVPELRRAVMTFEETTAGDDGLAVGANGQRQDPILMLHGHADGPAGRRVPLPCRAVMAAGDDGLAVGAERHGSDAVLVLEDGFEGLSGVCVPQPHRAVAARGEEGLAVGAERHGHDRALMPYGSADGQAGRRVPELRRLVRAAGQDLLAVGAERHGPDSSSDDGPGAGRRVCRWPRPRPLQPCRVAPVRMVLPSGLNATACGDACDARRMGRMGLPVAGVPEPHRPVAARGEEGLAVGTERHGNDRAVMHEWLADGPAGGRVPEPRRVIRARR